MQHATYNRIYTLLTDGRIIEVLASGDTSKGVLNRIAEALRTAGVPMEMTTATQAWGDPRPNAIGTLHQLGCVYSWTGQAGGRDGSANLRMMGEAYDRAGLKMDSPLHPAHREIA